MVRTRRMIPAACAVVMVVTVMMIMMMSVVHAAALGFSVIFRHLEYSLSFGEASSPHRRQLRNTPVHGLVEHGSVLNPPVRQNKVAMQVRDHPTLPRTYLGTRVCPAVPRLSRASHLPPHIGHRIIFVLEPESGWWFFAGMKR